MLPNELPVIRRLLAVSPDVKSPFVQNTTVVSLLKSISLRKCHWSLFACVPNSTHVPVVVFKLFPVVFVITAWPNIPVALIVPAPIDAVTLSSRTSVTFLDINPSAIDPAVPKLLIVLPSIFTVSKS